MSKVEEKEIEAILGLSDTEALEYDIRMRNLQLPEINKTMEAAGFTEYVNSARFEGTHDGKYKYTLRFWDRKREQYRHIYGYFFGVVKTEVEFD